MVVVLVSSLATYRYQINAKEVDVERYLWRNGCGTFLGKSEYMRLPDTLKDDVTMGRDDILSTILRRPIVRVVIFCAAGRENSLEEILHECGRLRILRSISVIGDCVSEEAVRDVLPCVQVVMKGSRRERQ